MTQMLLFDPPISSDNFTASSVVAAADCPSNETRPADTRPQVLESDADRGGVHHIGDLARLVLLRYELVARRRAALADRQAK